MGGYGGSMNEEERIALFLDYENLAIGAREALGGGTFDFRPIADALAERGRVVVRRAYADWSRFDDDRRVLTRHHVELIEMPQRMGHMRKNAADIKMAVDAIELSFERDYITTFVIGTGDSDFTPLVHKLRELNKRVIGIGIEASTSALLPPACDEFLFYERLEGVEVTKPKRSARGGSGRAKAAPSAEPRQADVDADGEPVATATEPDVLVIDEALGVGDERFQRKCAARIDDLRRHGATFVLVSHDLHSIRRLCSRALWLDAGQIRASGPAAEVTGAYLAEHDA